MTVKRTLYFPAVAPSAWTSSTPNPLAHSHGPFKGQLKRHLLSVAFQMPLPTQKGAAVSILHVRFNM